MAKYVTPTTKFRDELVYVSCPACGAPKGSRCRGRYGLKISRIHALRADKLKKKQEAA